MATKLTIRDIARLASVSIATVSRVLNQKPDVDPATRARILRIMDEQGFVPSVAGAGLAGGRTGLIGMLVPSLAWPIIAAVLSGVASVIEQTTHELVLYSLSHKQERSHAIGRILDAKLIDGLIAIYPDAAARPGDAMRTDRQVSRHLSELHEQGFPLVVIDDQGPHDRLPWISPDNRQGAMEAVRHLLSLGHRRIAHIRGPDHYLCARDRQAGYRAALEEASLTPEPELEVLSDFTSFGGRTAAARLFALPEPPTAIFAANDDMAFGALSAAEEQGVCVPEDVAVVGFDDAGPSAFTHPPLTSVRQPFCDMGRQATEILLTAIESPRPVTNGWYRAPASFKHFPTPPWETQPLRVLLPTQLVVRESSGALRNQPTYSDRNWHGLLATSEYNRPSQATSSLPST